MMSGYDLELAVQGLRRFPKSTLLAIFTVALGLSASMTTLALLHMLSADPLPGRSDRLYLVWVNTVQAKPMDDAVLKAAGIIVSNYHHIKVRDAEALLAAHHGVRQAALVDMHADVEDGNGAHRQKEQTLLATTGDFLPMFGVALRYGRGWNTAEDAARAPVAVIDADLAQRMFGTANAVGKTLRIKQSLFQVIGVVATYAPQPHFYEVGRWAFSGSSHENVFLPYRAALDAGLNPETSDGCDDIPGKKATATPDVTACAWLSYWVQLDTPAQLADYQDYLARYTQQQQAQAGYAMPATSELLGVRAWLTRQNVIPDNVRLNVWMAASFLLLCIVNVAGLLAAKFLRRSSEIGIRRALGASRRSVFAQHVLEAGAVCLLGGVLALPLTLLGLWVLRLQEEGFTDMARLDIAMFGGLFALALVVGVLVGLLPAWRASRVEPGLQVKSD